MTNFIFGLIVGVMVSFSTIALVCADRPTKDDYRDLQNRLRLSNNFIHQLEQKFIRQNDEIYNARKMSQYWRRIALKNHFGFTDAEMGTGASAVCPAPSAHEIINDMLQFNATVQAAQQKAEHLANTPSDSPADAPVFAETDDTLNLSNYDETAAESGAEAVQDGAD